jgi:hypothetical protein
MSIDWEQEIRKRSEAEVARQATAQAEAAKAQAERAKVIAEELVAINQFLEQIGAKQKLEGIGEQLWHLGEVSKFEEPRYNLGRPPNCKETACAGYTLRAKWLSFVEGHREVYLESSGYGEDYQSWEEWDTIPPYVHELCASLTIRAIRTSEGKFAFSVQDASQTKSLNFVSPEEDPEKVLIDCLISDWETRINKKTTRLGFVREERPRIIGVPRNERLMKYYIRDRNEALVDSCPEGGYRVTKEKEEAIVIQMLNEGVLKPSDIPEAYSYLKEKRKGWDWPHEKKK